MKRLWALLSTAILVVSVLGVFDTQHALAQSTDQALQAQLQTSGDALFTNFIAQLQAEQANPKQRADLTNATDAAIASYVQGNKDLITVVGQAQSKFDTLFATPAVTSANIYANFSAALLAAGDVITNALTMPTISHNGPLRFEITKDFTPKLNSLAQQQQNQLINSGQGDQAVNLQNAVGTQRKAQVANDVNAQKCTSLWNASVKDCIDAGFAWIIKNTILQLAGFLVWLTANMLNYAMQISILNFSQWASPSLYPIWVIVRQIISLFVVFAGLYLGFMYIIGQTDKFVHYIGWVVMYALFVNFSYPISRVLIDISNIISLNVYSASVGADTLTGTATNTAGGMIMTKLGLAGLMLSATTVNQTGFIGSINSTPGALIAVAFVLYAAYIFFMATAIIATRTAILVFLTVASPLLLVDSVVPKLGEVAVKIRKMFFEQLAVAPVFTIMLALTLKFMDVFQVGKGPLSNTGQAADALQTAGASGLQSFFSILMMLIMLHIMLKVTKSLAGEAGQYATNFMGKVGGFGLAAATMGTGVLARGTIGAAAATARDSAWMDKMQGNAAGRGLYTLTHSLAQSSYDARNVSAISGGLQKAGLTGGFGMTMQKPTVKNFDAAREARAAQVEKKAISIKDDSTRASYLANANKGRLVRLENERLAETRKSVEDKKQSQLEQMLSTTDPRKRESLINQSVIDKDYAMADKLRAGEQYHAVDNTTSDAAQQKANLLKKMGVDNAQVAKTLLNKDPFKDLADAHEGLIKQLQEDAAKINRKTPEGEAAYRDIQSKIGEQNASFRQKTDQLRKDTLAAFAGVSVNQPIKSVDIDLTGNDKSRPGGSDFSYLDTSPKPRGTPGASGTTFAESAPVYQQTATATPGSGGTYTEHMQGEHYETPVVMRNAIEEQSIDVASTQKIFQNFDVHTGSFKDQIVKNASARRTAELERQRQAESNPTTPAVNTSTARTATNEPVAA